MVVLVLATTVTWQIVSAADDRVSDQPAAPLNVAAPVITDPSSTVIPSTTSLPTSSTTSGAVSSTTITAPGTTTADTTPTTSTSTTPTTSPPPASWQTEVVQTSGGNVALRYRPGEVAYQSATPAPGYQVEVDDRGPPEVELEFESESHKVDIRAAWRDGDLDVDVSESSEDSEESDD